MHLKHLEIFGFKSFPDRMSLSFSPGITVVAGPNGSGKSNVVDALVWVLGEQSPRTLRIGRVQDVIFAGNSSRKPISYAEVSISIDNCDQALRIPYSEVVIKRGVDRSGLSEYYLNGSPCRLKDIQDLLMDTGIGRNAYAIVGQGKIDEILNQRPEERRYILEESVGIGRYRWRKKEAAQKLTEASRDLERLGDIIAELSLRIDEISPEADRALEYLKTWRTLRSLERKRAEAEVSRHAGVLDAIRREMREIERRLKENESKLKETEESMERLAEELSILEDKRYNAESEKSEMEAEKASLEGSLEALRSQSRIWGEIEDQKSVIASFESKRQSLITTLAEQERDLLGVAADVKKARALQRELRETLLSRASELREKRAELEEAKARIVDLLNDKAQAEKRLSMSRTLRESLERDLQRIEQQERARREQAERYREELARAERTLRELEEEGTRLAGHLEEVRSAMGSLSKEVANLSTLRAEKSAALVASKAKLETLQGMAFRHDGFGSGTRAILRAVKHGEIAGSGIIGPLGNLIEVGGEYALALAAALGGALDYLVVENEDTARRCIEYLKKRRAGRSTFLPLDMVRPSSLSQRELTIVGREQGTGVLISYLTYDRRIDPAVSHVLGRVIVAQDLDQAVRLWRAVGFSLRVVTLGGDVVRQGGSITGGHLGEGGRDAVMPSPVIRKSAIEALERRIREDEALLDAVDREIRLKEARIHDLGAVSEEALRALEEVRERVATLRVQTSNLTDQLRRVSEELKGLEKEREYALLSAGKKDEGACDDFDLISVIERIQSEISTIEGKRGFCEREIGDLEKGMAEVQGRLETISGEVGRLEEAHASRLQDMSRTKALLEETDREMADAQKRLDRLLAQEKEYKEDLQNKEERLRQLNAILKEMSSRYSTAKEEEEKTRSRLVAAEKHHRRLAQQVEADRSFLAEKRSLELKAESEVASWKTTLERLASESEAAVGADMCDSPGGDGSGGVDLWDPLNLETGRLSEGHGEYDAEELLSRIQMLKDRLDAIGPVSLPLIDERKHLLERKVFLDKQRQDLERSKASLTALLSEIDAEIARQFKESFDALRERFRSRFRSLFGGGEADLSLTPEDDWTSGGIEILARPPGRRVKNLSQLSGGERALTGISLIFSMLDYKPSPFVVLDEVEASLDEANATRFIRMLKDLSQRMQFIVVTHQRLTMEAADVIYGITMEEPGASVAVSLRL